MRAGSEVARGRPCSFRSSMQRDLDARVMRGRRGGAAGRAQAQLELARTELARASRSCSTARAWPRSNALDQRTLGCCASPRPKSSASPSSLAEADARDRQVLHGEIRSPGQRGASSIGSPSPATPRCPAAPLLRIYDPGTLRLEIPVRETLAVTLSPGDPLPVEIDALRERFAGTIEEIVPFAEPGARTLLVKVRLPADPRLYAGLFGRVEIPAGERTVVRVPRGAVRRVGQLEFAQVVGAEDRVERRLVTTGPSDDQGRVEVLSGLASGERVVVR